MPCHDFQILIHGDLDHELEPAEAARLGEHLAACAACRRAYDRQRVLRAAVKKHAAERFLVPEALHARILAALPAETSTPRVRLFPWNGLGLGVSLASAVFLTWSLTYFLLVPSQEERFVDEAVSGHLRSFLVNHLTDIASSDPLAVREWLESKLNFSPPVKELSQQGFTLVGGRLDYMYDQEVAVVVYRHGQEVINLFIWPAAVVQETAPRRFSEEGFHILLWTDAGIHFCSITKLDEKALAELAKAYGAGAS